MPGSSRCEKGVKLYGESDWSRFYCNIIYGVGCLVVKPACRSVVSNTYGVVVSQNKETENPVRLGDGDIIVSLYFDKYVELMRYSFADCHWIGFSYCLYCATLYCLVAYATVLIDLSKVSIAAVDIPLPFPNREVKPESADDTAIVGK